MRVRIGYDSEHERFWIRIQFENGRYAQAVHVKAWGAYEGMMEVLTERDGKKFHKWFVRYFGIYTLDSWMTWQRVSRSWREGQYANAG